MMKSNKNPDECFAKQERKQKSKLPLENFINLMILKKSVQAELCIMSSNQK